VTFQSLALPRFWELYRALATRDGNVLTWFRIGTHADYDKVLEQ
jgi:hypothetical protein